MAVRSEQVVRLFNAALDEDTRGDIVLRGVIDPTTLRFMRTDDYQREALPPTSHLQKSLMDAYLNGKNPPDILLGVRGMDYNHRNDSYTIQDIVWIIDGLQRVTAALNALQLNPDLDIRLGATLMFGTTRDSERELFRTLNIERLRVSASKLLANEREDSPGIAMLYGLSNSDKTFALYERVTWSQRMSKSDLMTALTLLKVTMSLHSHRTAGIKRVGGVRGAKQAMLRLENTVGIGVLRHNVHALMELVDECWGLRMVNYREAAPQVKTQFLQVVAKIMSDHFDFWGAKDDKRLFIDVDLRRKLKQFDVRDPVVQGLASASGRSRHMLYQMMKDHVNSGKRQNRLKPRDPDAPIMFETEVDEVDEAVG